jgi:hypothetical protein
MKKIFIIAFMAFFAACNNSSDKAKTESMKSDSSAATTTATTTMPDINSPYALTYSSKFEIGDPKNAETVLNLWKDWDNGNLMNGKNSFADTVTFHFSDGSMMRAARDSAVATGQKMRDNLASSTATVDAVMSVRSTDKNENWALIWAKEVNTNKKGKVDSSMYTNYGG